MTHLKDTQIQLLRGKLDARMQQLKDDIVRELRRSESERHREVAGAVADAGDESVANLVAELDAAEIERDVREVRMIEAAWERMKQGTFGLCLDCGTAIAWKRLLAEPVATRCVQCAERYEKTHSRAPISRL